MPPPQFERYNAKARGSVAGGSTHKKRRRIKPAAHGSDDEEETRHPRAAPQNNDVDGADYRDATRGMSTKKRKRFESYVAKKVKTDERHKTLQLLASLAPNAATSASLLSSSSLGQNPLQPSSAKERLEKREDRLVRQGIDRLSKRRGGGDGSGSESEEGDGDGQRGGAGRGSRKGKERVVEVVDDADNASDRVEGGGVKTTTIPTKNGVAQDSQTETGKRSKGSKRANWNPNLLPTQPDSDTSEFDSSDSGYDSPIDREAVPPDVVPLEERTSPATDQLPSSHSVAVKEATTAPAPSVAAGTFGGALKRSTDGHVVQSRVEIRRTGRGVGMRPNEAEGDDDIEGDDDYDNDDDSDDDDDDSDDGDGNESESHSEEDDESEDPADVSAEVAPPTIKRSLGFKSWALGQMGTSTPLNPTPDLLSTTSRAQPFPTQANSDSSSEPSGSKIPIPRTGDFVGPLGGQLDIPSSSLLDGSTKASGSTSRPRITRRQSVSDARMELPILAEEQSIVEAILMHPVVVICGETGSGKTTQVPQMLYEAGFGFKGSDNPGMIAITQPRRVAAVSLSARVKSELDLPSTSSLVAHQIRYSSTTSSETSIKFMTDGVLLRELASDFLLSRYSVVVVDEAHERGVNTDVLVGVLSRVAKLREKMWREERGKNEDKVDKGKDIDKAKGTIIRPLRIVIMSATLRVSDFTTNSTLFSTPPPVIHISARQHPVTVHFSRRTSGDYVTEAYKKVCKIHARLPEGGILVFMTGQGEIQAMCRKLERRFGGAKGKGEWEGKRERKSRSAVDAALPPEEPEAEDVDLGGEEDLAADVDDGAADSDPEALDSDDEDASGDFESEELSDTPMHILPLYSLLPTHQQMLVFKPPPAGSRLVIIATNVAETSLTIPGIRYVVDTGRAKERSYDATSSGSASGLSVSVQSFLVSWISKAAASQRAGRAGRTGPGHCYRLYSSALYEDHFPEFSSPEILRMPIEGVVLQMKSMNITQVINFPFPTPPDRLALKKAEDLLVSLGALEAPTRSMMRNGRLEMGLDGGRITELGKKMAGFPVSPRFAKMLVVGMQHGEGEGDRHGVLGYVVAVVACLSVGDPFVRESAVDGGAGEDDEEDEEDELDDEGAPELRHIRSEKIRAKEQRKEIRRRFFKAQSQFTSLGKGTSDLFKMLAAVGAYEYEPSAAFCTRNYLRLKAMQEIQQLRRQIHTLSKPISSSKSLPLPHLTPPSATQLKILRQILLSSFLDHLAVRMDIVSKSPGTFSSTRGVGYKAVGFGNGPGEEVYIHPGSVLFHGSPPDFVVFQEITSTTSRARAGTGVTNGDGLGEGQVKRWMKGVTKINPAWIETLGRGGCTYSRPVEAGGKGRLAGSGGGSVMGGDGLEREVIVVPHYRDLGVDLPAVKRIQRREGARWVLVE